MSDRWIDTADGRLWSTVSGTGPMPAILLNGGPGCDDYLAPVADLLAECCTVVRYEPRGCGRSDHAPEYTLAGALSDLEAVREAWDLAEVLLVGHSWGPDLGLCYLLEHPEVVTGLIGIAGGRIVNDRDWHAAYAVNREREQHPQTFTADPLVNKQLNADYKAWIKRPALLAEISGVSTPVRYILAGEDIRPHWPTLQLVSLLPDASVTVIDGATHYPWLTHATELGECLKAACRDITGGAP